MKMKEEYSSASGAKRRKSGKAVNVNVGSINEQKSDVNSSIKLRECQTAQFNPI